MEGCIIQVDTGMGWMNNTTAKEVSLKKCLCIVAAVVKKRLDARTQIPTYWGDKGLRKSYFPQLPVVIGNNSVCLQGFYGFS